MGEAWFGPKTYGYGIGPRGLAGWLVMGVYIALMAATPVAFVALHLPVWVVPVAFGLFTVALFVVIALKSSHEPMKWRWGGR